MAKKRYREYYYECIKAFPGYNVGDEWYDDSEEYSPSFYPEDHPKFFVKKYRYRTYDPDVKPSNIIIEDISDALACISPVMTPFLDSVLKGKDKKLYEWKTSVI